MFTPTDLILCMHVCVPINVMFMSLGHTSVLSSPVGFILFTRYPLEVNTCGVSLCIYKQVPLYRFIISPFFTQNVCPVHCFRTLLFFSGNNLPWDSFHIKYIQMCCILSNSCIVFHYRHVLQCYEMAPPSLSSYHSPPPDVF